MSATYLDQPVTGPLRAVNYFNGRLLTGDDLSTEQTANRAAHERLGRAIGTGVVDGLEVVQSATASGSAPALRVARGLAVTRGGRLLELAGDLVLVLTRDPGEAAKHADGAGRFAACAPPAPTAGVSGTPLLLLTVGPAPGVAQGRAPVETLGNEAATCAVDAIVEAIRFRLVTFTLPSTDPLRLRSRAANALLGSAGTDAIRLAEDPLGAGGRAEGLLEALVGTCLDPEEIPLALLSWPDATGLAFCDRWAARRRVRAPDATGDWHGLVGRRRRAVAEARLLQFQEQLADVMADGRAPGLVAGEELTHLPPAGLVPLATAERPGGFDRETFLAGVVRHREAWVEGARLGAILEAALAYPPIDLDRAPGEAVWRYLVRSDATPKQAADALRPDYLLFVTGHLPYAGNARWDLAHWDQANYAIDTEDLA